METILVKIEADNSKAIKSIEELEKYVNDLWDTFQKAGGDTSKINFDAFSEAREKLERLKTSADVSSESIDKTSKAFQKSGSDINKGMSVGTIAIKAMANQSESAGDTINKANNLVSGVMGKRINLEKELAKRLNDSKVKTVALASAKKLLAWATGGATGATKLYRLALIGTGIGAFVVLLGVMIVNWDRISSSIKEGVSSLIGWIRTISPVGALFGVIIDKIQAFAEKVGGIKQLMSGLASGVIQLFRSIGDVMALALSGNIRGAIAAAREAGEKVGDAFNKGVESKQSELDEIVFQAGLAQNIKNSENLIALEKARGKNTIELERALLQSKLGQFKQYSLDWQDANNELMVFEAGLQTDKDAAGQKARDEELKRVRAEQEEKRKIREEFDEMFRTMDFTELQLKLDVIAIKAEKYRNAGVAEVEVDKFVAAQKKLIQDDVDAKQKESDDKLAAERLKVLKAQEGLEDELYFASLDKRNQEQTSLMLAYEKRVAIAGDDEGLLIAALTRYLDDSKALKEKHDKEDVESSALAVKRKVDEYDYAAQVVKAGLDVIGGLGEIFAGKGKVAAKKQFEFNKKIQIAGALVDTFRAANGFLSIQPTTFANVAFASAAIVAGLVNVKKIASTKFEGGGPTTSSSSSPMASGTPDMGNFGGVDFSFLGQGGNSNASEFGGGQEKKIEEQGGVKAYVVGQEITGQQAIDQKIAEQASLLGG